MEYLISWILIIIALAITFGAELYIKHNYKKFSKVNGSRNLSGYETARKILSNNGLDNVRIEMVDGSLTDHYDPQRKVVNLSEEIYKGTSISSVSVAAHECGHAIQDKNGYAFLRIRSSLVPVVNLISKAGYIAIMIGIIFSIFDTLIIGIIVELAILAFQIVTLPVEFNASNRALKQIEELELLDETEQRGAKKVLKAAASTYVAGATSALLQLIRLILIFRGRDDD